MRPVAIGGPALPHITYIRVFDQGDWDVRGLYTAGSDKGTMFSTCFLPEGSEPDTLPVGEAVYTGGPVRYDGQEWPWVRSGGNVWD